MAEKNKLINAEKKEKGSFVDVTIRGTVVSKIATSKTLIFVVAAKNPDANKTDYPKFVAFENLSELDGSFAIGDRVTVNGIIRTSKKYPEGTLVPTSIKRENSRIDAKFEKAEYLPDANEVMIRGTLVTDPYIPNDSTSIMTLRVEHADGQVSYIRAISFYRAAAQLRQKKKGDALDAIGYIRTKHPTEVRDKSHTQSLVLTLFR